MNDKILKIYDTGLSMMMGKPIFAECNLQKPKFPNSNLLR